MERENLCNAIRLTAWGYVLLYTNINLGTLNILPDWLGYLLILSALPAFGEEEPSALLLRPLGILLSLWAGILWLTALFGISPDSRVISVIAAVISLYFHFQLLTNLADIAGQHSYPARKQLLALRTVQTVLTTILALPFPWQRQPEITVCILLVNLIIAVWICYTLFCLEKFFKEELS